MARSPSEWSPAGTGARRTTKVTIVVSDGVHGYVLWVPITPIEGNTPTLQVMPYWRRPMKHHGRQNGYLKSIHKHWARTVTLKQMRHGDVAFFDINCPHKTFVDAE